MKTIAIFHGLATFVHERLEWSLVGRSPEQSETELLCVDVAGYTIMGSETGGAAWVYTPHFHFLGAWPPTFEFCLSIVK